MAAYYAETSGTQTTNADKPTPIPGLTIEIPAGVQDNILIIVNLPNPYAKGKDHPGAWIGVAVDGKVLPNYASFTYNEKVPPSTGRMPTTLVVSVPLTLKPQKIEAVWYGIRGSTVVIDTPASLSGVL